MTAAAIEQPGGYVAWYALSALLDTTSLSGRERIVVLALSLSAPAVVAVDKAIQLRRQGKVPQGLARTSAELKASRA